MKQANSRSKIISTYTHSERRARIQNWAWFCESSEVKPNLFRKQKTKKANQQTKTLLAEAEIQWNTHKEYHIRIYPATHTQQLRYHIVLPPVEVKM